MAPKVNAENPIIIDLGKRSRKKLKALKRSEGEIVDEVAAALRQRLGASIDEGGSTIPVLFLFEEKPKKSKKLSPLLSPLLRY